MRKWTVYRMLGIRYTVAYRYRHNAHDMHMQAVTATGRPMKFWSFARAQEFAKFLNTEFIYA